MPELINWDDVRNEYESTAATLQELALKFGVSDGTIRSRKCREKWIKGSVGSNATRQRNAATSTDKSKGATQRTQRKSAATNGKATEKKATKSGKESGNSSPPRQGRPKRESSPGKTIKAIIEYHEKLTEKERLFCFNFVNVHRFNATQSYYNAYGCSYESARRLGSLLLTKLDIRAEITRLKEIKFQSVMLNAEDLVEKHMRIAFSNITDFVEFGRVEKIIGKTKNKVFDVKTGKEIEIEFPLTATVNDVRFRESTEVDGDLIQEVKMGRDGASIKLYDAQKSMDWLERYFTWNPMDQHKKRFDEEKLRLEREKVDIQRETLKKENGETPEQGVVIVDDIK